MTKGGGLRRFKSLASLTPAIIGAATASHTHRYCEHQLLIGIPFSTYTAVAVSYISIGGPASPAGNTTNDLKVLMQKTGVLSYWLPIIGATDYRYAKFALTSAGFSGYFSYYSPRDGVCESLLQGVNFDLLSYSYRQIS